jgi:rhomboid protease GluP
MDGSSGADGQTFAAYLAKALIGKKGYRPGTVPEARVLLDHCDHVLTMADGMMFAMAAIVDRQADPLRRFSLSREELDRIGRECQHYTGSTGGAKMPVLITVIEIGAGPVSEADKERLKPLKNKSPFSKVLISAIAVDIATGETWTNTPLRARSMRGFMKGLMTAPRLGDEELRPEPHAAMPEARPLVLTYGLLAALLAIFACEYIFAVDPGSGLRDPSMKTMAALGALDRETVIEGGQWWRLFTAPLLHGGLLHIAFNGIALFFAGAVLENVIGRAWFAGVFAVSAVTGAAMSLAMHADAISVGASGAIMGLFAAAFAVAYRYPVASPMRTFLISGSLRVLIPSMLPLFGGLMGENIDYAAHLGGAIGGAAVGALLVAVWDRDAALPPMRGIAWALAAAFLCCAAYGGAQAAKGYDQYALYADLIPAQEIPEGMAGAVAKSEGFAAKYPHDPRAHMYRALAFQDAGDQASAEREWKAALSESKMLKAFFKPDLEEFLRANLAGTLKENGKKAEALETAKPICEKKGEILSVLEKEGLCP